jgi:hypothetical protein
MPRSLHALPSEQCTQHPPGTRSQANGTCARAQNMLGTWEVSPHQETAARHRSSTRAHACGTPGNSARRGCGQEARRKLAQRRACGRQCDGDPGAVASSASTDSKAAGARARVERELIGLHDAPDSAACERMRGRARCKSASAARRHLRWRVWEGAAAAPRTACCATCSPAIVPAPVTGLMADSAQDDMFEDALRTVATSSSA